MHLNHHGVSSVEKMQGIIPIKDADTSAIGLICWSADADQDFFPRNEPVLITSLQKAISKAGKAGNLASSLEAISQITTPTIVVVCIPPPFSPPKIEEIKVDFTRPPVAINEANQSIQPAPIRLVDQGSFEEGYIKTALTSLQRSKSVTGITPKIILVPEFETLSVTQAIASLCKKLRAFAYVTPRDEDCEILDRVEDVANFRESLSAREIMLIWPEWVSGYEEIDQIVSDEVNDKIPKEWIEKA